MSTPYVRIYMATHIKKMALRFRGKVEPCQGLARRQRENVSWKFRLKQDYRERNA